MKRILLVCLMVLLVQGVCLAKIEKQVDDFDASYAYYVNDYHQESSLTHPYIRIRSTFNLVFDNDNTIGSTNLILSFKQDDVYSMDSTINMRIDNNIYTWSTDPSTRSNDSVELVFDLPSNVYDAIMKTKKDIAVRFTYHSLTGHYKKDYIIPFKTIKDVQTMYKTYYKPETTSQAAE